MKIRSVILVVLALTCGASAAIGVNQLWHTQNRGRSVETVPVVMAASDVSRGGLLAEDLIRVVQWPQKLVPAGALTNLEDAVGRSVAVPLVKGEPVLEAKLANKDTGRGLASLIPNGMRAFTIRTPHASAGVGGFILPGNRVDVLLTTTISGRNDPTGGGATTTLLQNVKILAVAQFLDAPDNNRVDLKDLKSVTLLVPPDQAAKLDLGMNKGILHLALRHPDDEAEADTLPVTLAQLQFYQEKPLPGRSIATLLGKVVDMVGQVAATAEKSPTAGLNAHMPKSEPKPSYTHIVTVRGRHTSKIRVERIQ